MFLRGELSTVPADGTLWPSTLVRVLSRQRGGAGRLRARHLRGVERSSPQRLGCFQANVLASCGESHAVFAEDGVCEFDNLVGVRDLHVQEEAADVALVLLARRCLLKRWDKKKNGKLEPENVLSGSGLTAWWRCERGHSFPAVIENITRKFICGDCSGTKVTADNCLHATHPHLVEQFDFSRNGKFTPDNITAKSRERLSWICELGHDWPAEVVSRARGSRCLYCINKSVWVGFNDMATTRPDMASDWDDANGDLKPTDVVAGTNKKLWWKCDVHGAWQATGQAKSKGGGCQDCLAERIEREREQVRAATGVLSPSMMLGRLERTSRRRQAPPVGA